MSNFGKSNSKQKDSTESKEGSEKKVNKAKKNEIVYEYIIKEKKKKRVLLSFYGFSVQQQKIFFRIMLLVLHVLLFLIYLFLNGFQITIPYRL